MHDIPKLYLEAKVFSFRGQRVGCKDLPSTDICGIQIKGTIIIFQSFFSMSTISKSRADSIVQLPVLDQNHLNWGSRKEKI